MSAFHRIRNRRTLTVVSLHRVLAKSDPRWRTCDPLYTMTDRTFESCVRFLARHYSIVSLDELEAASIGTANLPPNAALITFDDGWADNYDYAMPILRRCGVPAALFVAAGAINRHDAFFQERMIAAWRTGRINAAAIAAAWARACPSAPPVTDPVSETKIRTLIAGLQQLPPSERSGLLATLKASLSDPERQMLTKEEVGQLHESGFGIGTHGYQHEPLTAVDDLDFELGESRRAVADIVGIPVERVVTMSFPFSKASRAVAERAQKIGYRLMFAGGHSMLPTDSAIPCLVPRVGITEQEVVDENGSFVPHALASQLFRLPHRGVTVV